MSSLSSARQAGNQVIPVEMSNGLMASFEDEEDSKWDTCSDGLPPFGNISGPLQPV